MKNLFVSSRFTWLPTLAVLFAGLSMVNVSKAAHPLDDLETRYPLPTSQELNNAAYGNGTWVITGRGGTTLNLPRCHKLAGGQCGHWQ